MPTKTYQGYTYEQQADGSWARVGAAVPTPMTIGRPDPYKAEDQGFQRDANDRAARAEARADDAERRAQQADARAAEKQAREGQTLEARGGVETTEGERKAAFLATRVAGGMEQLKKIGMGRAPTLFEATAGQTALGNFSNDEDWQRTLAVQRDLTDALLTLGTGAAYTAEQIDAYRKSYFPQPGDKPGTIADKKQRLSVALEAARLGAGAASGMIDGALENSGLLAAVGTPEEGAKAIEEALRAGRGRDEILAIASRYNLSPDEAALDANLASRGSGGSTSEVLPPDDYQSSIVGQGVSGVNEGIASTLGLPADAMAWAMNLVPQGINAVANTDIPTIDDPVLGGDWWRNRMDGWGIYAESDDPAAQFVRRTGQSLGAAIVPAGFAGTAGRSAAALVSGATGGAGAATAQQVAPGNVEAEIIAELLTGGAAAGGFAKAGQRGRQAEIEEAIPSIDDLKGQAGNLYRQAEARGVVADPMMTQQLADDMRATLRAEGRVSPTGRVSEVYPKAREAMQLVDDYAGQPMSPTQMQTVRSVISDGQTSIDPSERRIAGLLLDTFDNFVDPLAPDLADARQVASRYLNAQKIAKAKELAEARASQFTGSGLENAYRTEFRKLDRDVIQGRGRYGDEVVEALQNVSRGTPLSNTARNFGRLAPTGPVSFGLGTVAPATLGTMMAGPVGGLAAGGIASTVGGLGRKIATDQTVRNADLAELIARNDGAIPMADLLTPKDQEILFALMASEGGKYLEDGSGQ